MLTATTILLAGYFASTLTFRWIEAIAEKSRVDRTLSHFVARIIQFFILGLCALTALAQIGVETTSLFAVIGAAGIAIGLALQSMLSNLAAGIVLVVFRYFRTGDFVDIAGEAGTVQGIEIFTTVIKTSDQREVTVPNGRILTHSIINYSRYKTRRLELSFSIGYNDSVIDAKACLVDLFTSHHKVLSNPPPFVGLGSLENTGVILTARIWCNRGDFGSMKFELLEQGKAALDATGFSTAPCQKVMHSE